MNIIYWIRTKDWVSFVSDQWIKRDAITCEASHDGDGDNINSHRANHFILSCFCKL